MDERQQLVVDYKAGMTGRQLAEKYALARSSVIQLLKHHGVVVRHPRLTADDIVLTVGLYRQGVRQIDIAERLGRSKSVVWHALRRAGEL